MPVAYSSLTPTGLLRGAATHSSRLVLASSFAIRLNLHKIKKTPTAHTHTHLFWVFAGCGAVEQVRDNGVYTRAGT